MISDPILLVGSGAGTLGANTQFTIPKVGVKFSRSVTSRSTGEKPFRYSRIALTAYGAVTCSMPGGNCHRLCLPRIRATRCIPDGGRLVYVADRAKGTSIQSKRHIY